MGEDIAFDNVRQCDSAESYAPEAFCILHMSLKKQHIILNCAVLGITGTDFRVGVLGLGFKAF